MLSVVDRQTECFLFEMFWNNVKKSNIVNILTLTDTSDRLINAICCSILVVSSRMDDVTKCKVLNGLRGVKNSRTSTDK